MKSTFILVGSLLGSISSYVNLTSNVPSLVGKVWVSANAGTIKNGTSNNTKRNFMIIIFLW